MKTLEELNALKEEVETVSRKFSELSEEELEQVNGGFVPDVKRTHKDPNLEIPSSDWIQGKSMSE